MDALRPIEALHRRGSAVLTVAGACARWTDDLVAGARRPGMALLAGPARLRLRDPNQVRVPNPRDTVTLATSSPGRRPPLPLDLLPLWRPARPRRRRQQHPPANRWSVRPRRPSS